MSNRYFKGLTEDELFNPKRYTKQQTNLVLSGSYNEKGIKRWWSRKNLWLDDQTPLQVWESGDKKRVYNLALQLLGQIAT